MKAADKRYCITKTSPYTGRKHTTDPLTIAEAIDYFGYTLECGKAYEHEKGNKKVNMNPKSISSLMTALNNAGRNRAANGCGDYYTMTEA